ncbi:hypothetical protein ACHAPJ_006637 [Fusarium lateritium]
MPSSIPYDPSLTMLGVVEQATIDNLIKIADAQAPVDAAQTALNSLITYKRSLLMTKTELMNLNVKPSVLGDLEKDLSDVDTSIGTAAGDYAKKKAEAEKTISGLRGAMPAVHSQIESPVDYLQTQIKMMPLAADTMNMDVQYFSYDTENDDASSFASNIASYISGTVSSVMGPDQTAQISSNAAAQVNNQTKQHTIDGTLVLSVTCTHKNASVVAPFVLNVDKAVEVWNGLFQDDQLDPDSGASMVTSSKTKPKANAAGAGAAGQATTNKFSIISGTTFGSSFVGMVHVLNSTDTSASETMQSAAASLQATMNVGGWYAKSEGKVGVDSKFAGDVKNLLSQQNVTSHVTLLSMGVIPSIVANDVSLAVEKFATFDPKANMDAVLAMQSTTASQQTSIQSEADASRASGQASDMQGKTIGSSLSALATIEDGKNKILDINSMMTALDDYLRKAADGKAGVPINYFLKDINKQMLAQMWVAKYYPNKYMAIKYDDSAAGGSADADKAPASKL